MRTAGTARRGHRASTHRSSTWQQRSRQPDTSSNASRSRSAESRARTSSPSAPAPVTGSSSSARTSTRCVAGRGAQRQRVGRGGAPRRCRGDDPPRAAGCHHPLRLLGRRGGRPVRLGRVRRRPRPPTPSREIDGYLNFDMLGSPNGLSFVYDEPGAAPGSEALTGARLPARSSAAACPGSRSTSPATPTTGPSPPRASPPVASSAVAASQ